MIARLGFFNGECTSLLSIRPARLVTSARGARRLNGVGLRDITPWDAEEVRR
jgi:hypothetical protein